MSARPPSRIRLGHYSVRTADLEASRRFYVDVVGLRVGHRPPFAFPGLWLYQDENESDYGVVHLIAAHAAADVYLGGRVVSPTAGSGAVDHVAFLAQGWAELRARCREAGIAYAERSVPVLGLHQVFLTDPSGIKIEMNYEAAEAAA